MEGLERVGIGIGDMTLGMVMVYMTGLWPLDDLGIYSHTDRFSGKLIPTHLTHDLVVWCWY
jgi:hypothetical protein